MNVEEIEQLKADFEESKRKEKTYFKQIVAANNVLRKMPQDKTVYCGACGQRLKVALSSSQKEWFEALRSALLFPAAQDTSSEEKTKEST